MELPAPALCPPRTNPAVRARGSSPGGWRRQPPATRAATPAWWYGLQQHTVKTCSCCTFPAAAHLRRCCRPRLLERDLRT